MASRSPSLRYCCQALMISRPVAFRRKWELREYFVHCDRLRRDFVDLSTIGSRVDSNNIFFGGCPCSQTRMINKEKTIFSHIDCLSLLWTNNILDTMIPIGTTAAKLFLGHSVLQVVTELLRACRNHNMLILHSFPCSSG